VKPDFDVVIVGGGAAGIGAARRLAASNLSTLLLEAQSRLGGRAWTQQIAGLPLDLGCGWLHSAEKNSWMEIAKASGVALDRRRAAWGIQYRDLGFSAAEQSRARRALDDWTQRLTAVRDTSDRAADALEPQGEWNEYVRAIAGFISGARLEQLSATDYLAYDEASTDSNWRTPSGLGALVARSFPESMALRLATVVERLRLAPEGMMLETPAGAIGARACILCVSTAVLAGDALELPAELDPWRDAARTLPLGRNEKLFLEINGAAPFENETQVIGSPRDASTASCYIRPLGMPVIECFLGAHSAHIVEEQGTSAAFAFVLDQLAALFGSRIRTCLRPLASSSWGRSPFIGGAYSYALPGHRAARQQLAQPFDQRVYFAGEATSAEQFSTVHGALDSGARAADEVIEALTRSRAAQRMR